MGRVAIIGDGALDRTPALTMWPKVMPRSGHRFSDKNGAKQ
ncbi:hypothetical protein SAMN02799631_00738 [Methylobacterium sp. 174MFSha1.1]|nr:hypothetical protein SAMN02799631_00738 [Methylobacterium sp. 174MFSha1.1]